MYYRLEGKEIIKVSDELTRAETAALWEIQNRRVRSTFINEMWVSTIFLVLDHAHGMGEPVLFETMAFEVPDALKFAQRACTYDEAVTNHRRAVDAIASWHSSAGLQCLLSVDGPSCHLSARPPKQHPLQPLDKRRMKLK